MRWITKPPSFPPPFFPATFAAVFCLFPLKTSSFFCRSYGGWMDKKRASEGRFNPSCIPSIPSPPYIFSYITPIQKLTIKTHSLSHLMVSRPVGESASIIEELVLDRCESDVHIALLTFWILRAYYSDLKYTPSQTPSPALLLVKRVS